MPRPPRLARPRRAENLLETAHGAGVELRPTPIDPHGPVFRLNRSAALVWRGVDGRRSVNDLAALARRCLRHPGRRGARRHPGLPEALSGAGLVFGVYGPGNAIMGERA